MPVKPRGHCRFAPQQRYDGDKIVLLGCAAPNILREPQKVPLISAFPWSWVTGLSVI